MQRYLITCAATVVLMYLPSRSEAQARPFVYSLLPDAPVATVNRLSADLAYGHDVFHGLGAENFEQRLGLLVPLRRALTLMAEAGWAPHDDATGSDASVRGELLARLPLRGRATLALGAGGMYDYSRTPVALGRLVFGYTWAHTQAAANLRLEHPFSSDSGQEQRDPVDVIMTLGLSHAVNGTVRLGVESVAEDLEGLVESDEAEGGAKLMVGPSLGFAPPRAQWSALVIAGPVLHLSQSSVSGAGSGAPRDLSNSGYVVRTSVTFQW